MHHLSVYYHQALRQWNNRAGAFIFSTRLYSSIPCIPATACTPTSHVFNCTSCVFPPCGVIKAVDPDASDSVWVLIRVQELPLFCGRRIIIPCHSDMSVQTLMWFHKPPSAFHIHKQSRFDFLSSFLSVQLCLMSATRRTVQTLSHIREQRREPISTFFWLL